MSTETQPTCTLISQSGTYHGKQGLEYFHGISSETAGARSLCLHVVTIPPEVRAKPHLHENHESAVYVISGEAGMWVRGSPASFRKTVEPRRISQSGERQFARVRRRSQSTGSASDS